MGGSIAARDFEWQLVSRLNTASQDPSTLATQDMLDIAEQRGIALHAAIDAHLTRQRANGMA